MPFADELLGEWAAQTLLRSMRSVAPDIEFTALQKAVVQLEPLGLRERADLLRNALLADVPGDYDALARLVRAAMENGPGFRGWLIWPVTSAVAVKAVTDASSDAFDDGLTLLAELTGRLTSEFAIRTLLNHDLHRALAHVQEWTASDDVDVRRLASEGTRPYLPWSVRVPRIIALPGVTVPILDALYRDDSEYVRRSVANHLNDISRHASELVVETAARWLADPDANTERVVRHGLRTLVKNGDPGALALLGFSPADVDVDGPRLDRTTVEAGGDIRFTATVRNTGTEPARLAIDYIVYHRKANGTQTGKTFKLTAQTLEPGASVEISRTHSFRVITTRRYHPGPHAVALQVNGIKTPRAEFDLTG